MAQPVCKYDGEIARIDILVSSDEVVFWFFARNHDPKSYAEAFDVVKQPFDLDTFIASKEAQGYVTRRWNGGARLFFGSPFPIRSKSEIFNLRKRLEDQMMRNGGEHPAGYQVHTLDLAYDL